MENSPFLKAEYLQTVGTTITEEKKLEFASQTGKLGVSGAISLKKIGDPPVGPQDR